METPISPKNILAGELAKQIDRETFEALKGPKDSGERRQFATGAVRDRAAGKGRFDLLFWAFIWRCAKWMEAGARKYTDRNWEKGIPSSAFLDSAFRHLAKHAMGYRDEDHLAAVYFNIQGLAFNEYMVQHGARAPELLDIPSYVEWKDENLSPYVEWKDENLSPADDGKCMFNLPGVCTQCGNCRPGGTSSEED